MGCSMQSINGLRQDIDNIHKLNNCCCYDFARAIETAQAELPKELSKRQLLFPIAPIHDESSVLGRFWWDNFDANYLNGYTK